MKRSLNAGYAGVDNPLFINDNNSMYLGDAKDSVEKLVTLIGDDVVAQTGKDGGDIEAPQEKAKQKAVEEFIANIPSLRSSAFLKVGVVKEIAENEAKVAIVPEGAARLLKNGICVYVESNAGAAGDFYDKDYEANGAIILQTAQEVYDAVDIIVKIREPQEHPVTGKHEIDMLAPGKNMISFLGPRTDQGKALMDKAVAAGVNLLAVDAIPRISRAQSLDVVSTVLQSHFHSMVEAILLTVFIKALVASKMRRCPSCYSGSIRVPAILERRGHGCWKFPGDEGSCHRRWCCRFSGDRYGLQSWRNRPSL